MKKFIVVLAVCFCAVFVLSAKTWQNSIAAGVSVPMNKAKFGDWKVNGESQGDLGSMFQIGPAFNATYLGLHESGFSVKGDFSAGGVSTKDYVDGTSWSSYISYSLGAGYSFIHDQKFTLSLFGIFGMDFMSYDDSETIDTDIGDVKIDMDTDINLVFVGADLSGIYHFTQRFGMFANLSARWIVGGKAKFDVETSPRLLWGSDTVDCDGGFEFVPTLGLCVTF